MVSNLRTVTSDSPPPLLVDELNETARGLSVVEATHYLKQKITKLEFLTCLHIRSHSNYFVFPEHNQLMELEGEM